MTLDEDEFKLLADAKRRGKIEKLGRILWITALVIFLVLLFAFKGYREYLIWSR